MGGCGMSRKRGGRRYPVRRFDAKSHRLTQQTFAWCLNCEFRRNGDAHTVGSQSTEHTAVTGHPVRWDSFSAGLIAVRGVDPPEWPS